MRLLRELQAEGRPATDDEKRVLARWSGWGSLPIIFESRPTRAQFRDDDGTMDEEKFARRLKEWESFAPERAELRGLLDEREWNEGARNTLNAHYTDASMVSAVWDAVRKLGFDGGNVLEPGSGSGTFIGLAPDGAHMTGIELDSTTAGISQALYPHATVRNESFADTRLPEGTFDAVVGNVPFGNYELHDKKYNKNLQHSIHNHFIIKSLALAKPGGLVAVITSRYTMDSEDSAARREMAKMGDLVGAVRLPEGAHRAAAGTDVVTDVLVFRKRAEGEERGDTSWIDAPVIDVNGSPHPVNTYFQEHPEQILGEMTTGRGQFTAHDLTVKGDRNAGPALAAALDRVVAAGQAEGKTFVRAEGGPAARIDIPTGGQRHDGALVRHPDGSFTQMVDGRAEVMDVHPDHVEQLGALVDLRDAARALLEEESASSDDTPRLADLRAELNRRYEAYTRRWGAVSKRAHKRFTPAEARERAAAEGRTAGDADMRPTAIGHAWDDPAMAIVFALDDYDPETKRTRTADILHKRVVAAKSEVTSVDDPADALAIVMDRTGGNVDLAQIADLLGTDTADARKRLGDRVFDVPGTDGKLASAAEYLSGNVRKKLAAARAAAEEDPQFALNVAALEAVVPRDLTSGEIDAKMGAAWIPADVIEKFLNEVVTPGHRVIHPGGSTWVVEGPGKESDAASVEWGTEERPAAAIAEALLKQQTIRVTKTQDLGGGKKKSLPDPEGTIAAQQKAQEMAERFADWIWEDEARADRLTREYNDRFNSYVLRSYDGAKPAMPGLAAGWVPREHQNGAVARILNEPAVLLAHEVGAGKTLEMVMGAMELRRTGMAKKPAIVVPNHMLEQFTREFLEAYPNANILAAGTKDLTGDNRRRFVARAATGDWDCVILTQKAFEKIDMHPDSQRAYMEEELAQLRAQMERAKEYGEDNRAFKQLERQLVKAEEKLKEKLDSRRDEGAVYWENTGIDYLMVDEAHMFKNLRTPSRIEGAGIAGSTRASDLHMKLHYLRSKSASGRVVTLATGTPIANSVTEAYTMMRYLRPDLLEEAGIEDFDTWAATFGEVVTDVEMNPDGNGFRMKARFAKFQNVPELLRMYRVSADVKTAADLNLPTPAVRRDANGNRGETVVIPADDAQLEYIQELGVRAEAVRARKPWAWVNDPGRGIKGMPQGQYEELYGPVPPQPEDPADRDPNAPRLIEDNMLKISGDGKRAALDMRLIDPNLGGEGAKINTAADKIAEIFNETKDRQFPTSKHDPTPHPNAGALQIVFMDQGTPKPKKQAKKKPAAGEQEDAPAIVGDGDQSTWAAYDEMKAQLVARGIPAEKIRYIHEATTDAQKAKLFEDARIGKIAVLLGSTEKMGTGTNVQARAVALHHMDVPWRPADLAQREGRVERQGNFNRGFNAEGVYDHDLFLSTDPEAPVGDVRIMRYVTEGTFDGYSWQTVERKAKFIAQMQRGNLDVREIEDIGDSALSFAEVKALAAGNPYLLDKAKADAEAHRLERLQRSHARTQAGLSSKIDRLDHEIRITRENIDEWTEAREARVDTRGDAFSMTLDGRDEPVTKRADVYGPILAAVTELRDGPYRDGHRVRIGVLGGHPVYATRARVLRGDNWFRGVKLGFDWPGGTTSYISSEITEGSAQGMLSSLQGRLEKLEPLIEGGRSSLRTMTGQQESARAMLGRPFAYTAQLQAAQARAKLLDDILKTQAILDELKDEEKKPAEERSEAYQTAQAELVVLKASLDVAREQIIPDPAAEPDRDITPVLEDPTPTVSTDRGGFAFLEDAPEHGDAPEPPAQTAPADWERELREVYNAPDAADAVRDLVDALDVPTRTADDQQRIQDALQALDYEVDLVVDGIRDEHMEWGERGEDHVRWLTDMVAEARGRLREQRPGTPSAPSSGSSGSGGSGGRGRRIGGPATEQSDSDTEYPSPPEERAAGMDAAGWERELRERYDAPEAADAVRDLMAVVDAPFPTFEDDPYDEEFEAHMARVRELYEAAGDEVEELRGRLSGEPGWRNSYGEQVTSPNREWLAGLLDELRARTRAQGYDTPFPTGTAADRRDRARARRSGDTTPGTAQDAPATAPQAPDGPAPLDGVSDADMRLLASLIEEEAAAYKWTGSPARYIAELFAKKTGTGRFDGDSDPAVQKWAEDYLAANPGLVDLPASERERRKRERAEREAASTEDAAALTRQSHDRFEAGDYEAALALIDQAEQLDPRGRDWDDIRAIIREERDSTTPAAAVDRPTAVVDPEELQAGDRIRVVRSGSGVHRVRTRGGGSYLAQGDGRVWEGTIPAGYQPGEPVRLDNVIEYNGNQPGRYLAEPAIVRLTGEVERLGTADAEASAAEAARVRTEQQQRGQSLVDELVAARRAMLREEGGDDLLEAVTRFEELLAARNNGDADAAYLEDAWLRADAGLAAAKETTADSLRRAQLRTMQTNLLVQLGNAGGRSGEARRRAAEWEQAKQEAARIADDGLPESADISDVQAGDRVDTPSGEETVTVEEVTRAGGLTFTTERDSDDRRTIRARRGAEQVTRRTSTRKPPEVGPATADNVAVGEWLVGDDGDAVKVVGIDRDGDRITFDVLGPNGPALVDVDAGEMVTRGRGLRMKRPKKPRQPRPLRERTPRSTIVALDDGTPATRIRLRSDIRKRVLGLNVEDDAAASEQAREAAARLRASQPVPAEQMRALSQHLRSLASGEDLPAVQRRALERAAAWVDGSYAKLAGYPAPPHDPGRAVPEKASPENLTAGDVIAIPDVGGGRVRPVRVIDARPVSRFPFVSVTVEHDDGRREQRILAAAADVYLMPDLPEDAETPPAVPVAARREHIRPDQLEPGDTIVVGGQERKVVMAYRFSDPLNPVESWRVYAEGGDGDELVLTSRGFPSVLRTARGEGSADQPWETLLDDSAAEPVTAGQVGLGDRIALDAAHGGVEGTVEELAPLKDSDGTRIGSTAMVRTYGDELVPVALLDGDDSLRITRYQSGGAHAETNIKRWQERRREWDRVRAVRQALGEAETDLYREASAAISEQLSMRRVHPPEPESGDRVWTMAGDLVEQAWQRLDNSAPALQAGRVLAGGDEAHAAALAERIEPLVGQIRERAMYNFIQSIFEANPMPGETYDQALARVLEQFRTDPPRTVDFSLVRRLHVRELFEDGGARPEAVPAPAGDLGERMAAYRKALPGNLGEVGHRQVTRTVYKPLDLEALDDGFDPEIEQVTVTVPDVAADGGPGEYAMRHLAVIKAAGADLDQEVTKRLDSPAYRNAAAAEKTAAEAVAAAEKELAAATDKANREAMASRGGVSSAAAHKEFEKANRAAVKARKAHEAAALRVGELRRQAALDVLSQVRSFGGARLTYLNKNGQARKETHKPVQAMRRVEDVYPAEWVGLLGDHGPVRLGIAVDTIMGGPGRAKYNPSQHAISMPDVSPEEQFRTGVHELGHAFQTLLPGLKEAEHAYLWERTAVGDIGHRERGDRTDVGLFPGEAGYDGGFPKPYTGRVYPTGHGEIFTTGMESLMAGSDYLDDDMRTWLLGVLALLGTGSDGPGKDPLDGVDLDELSVEQLKALLGQIEWGSPAYQRVMAQLRGRRIEDDPLEGIDLDSLGVEDLTDLLGSVDDLYSAARVSEVLEEWDTEDQQERQRNAAIDKLVSSGEMDYDQAWARVHGISEESMRAERYADAAGLGGLTSREREQKLRQQFHEWKEARFWEAETATNGFMLNARGRAAGIDPMSLFSGQWSRVSAYASDELMNWFERNGWKNLTEWRAEALANERDVRAARRSREGRRTGR